jgi:hypothetical protein
MNKIIGRTVVIGLAIGVSFVGITVVHAADAVQPALVTPSGVGGCIYRNLPSDVNRDAVNAVLSHGNIESVLKEPMAKAAPKCTGRPFSVSDGAVIGSIFSVYSRMVAAFTLGRQLQLPERQLIQAWTAATPEERAPYLASAQTFIRPDATFQPAKQEASKPFEQRLGIGGKSQSGTVPQLLNMYYSAMALSQTAEADLAARGMSPATGG